MQIEVLFTPKRIHEDHIKDSTVVVIDVVRATTCMAEAIASGARVIFPVDTAEKAKQIGSTLDREGTLLCGERGGLKIEGFDLGNSPAEFTPEAVADKQLIMTTTNGTRALLSVDAAKRILAGSFLNLGAVVNEVLNDEKVVMVCAGKEGRFSLDDALCAGHIVKRLERLAEGGLALNDAATAASVLAATFEPTTELLATTAAGKQLIGVGLSSDLELCAQVDKHVIIPAMSDGGIKALQV